MKRNEFEAFFERMHTQYKIAKVDDGVSRIDFIDRGVCYAAFAYEDDSDFLQLVQRVPLRSDIDADVLERVVRKVESDLKLVKISAYADDDERGIDVSTEQLEPDPANAERVFWRAIDAMSNAAKCVAEQVRAASNADESADPSTESIEKGLRAGCHAESDATAALKAVRSSLGLIVVSSGSGSAFCFQSDAKTALFLTNAHVVSDEKDVTLYLQYPEYRKYSGRVIANGASHDIDLAVVKINADSIPPLRFATSLPECGTPVAVAGYPRVQFATLTEFGEIVPSVHFGTVTAVNAKGTKIMHDATSRPGNSGGPLFDPSSGEVVGVETLGWETDETFIGISINSVVSFVNGPHAAQSLPQSTTRKVKKKSNAARGGN